MRNAIILIVVCIAVSFVGCDARPTAPMVSSESSSSACVNSNRKAYKKGKRFDCEYREKVKR
jgi:hypothetical protein